MIQDIYLDTETTGLQAMLKGTETPGKHDVIQVAAILGEEQFEGKCQPHRWDSIAQQALDVHGYQIADLRKFDLPELTCIRFRDWLKNLKVGEGSRYRLIAHNMPFDYKMLKAWFIKCGFSDWDEFFLPQAECLCTKKIGNDAKKKGLLPGIENMKLITAAAYIDFRFNAHDALGDTLACKAWHEHLMGLGQESAPGGPDAKDLIAEGKDPEVTGGLVL